jgi:carboxyl-terminal processing protease
MVFAMFLLKRAIITLGAGAILAGGASAQVPGKGTKLTAADTFAIGEGSSFSASTPGAPNRTKAPAPSKAKLIESELAEALALVRHQHVSGSSNTADKLASHALKGMLRALDPHSAYYDPREFAALLGEHNSEYSGTGSTIVNFRSGGGFETYIVGAREGTPASRAGLAFGDRIIAVNGEPVSGRSTLDVRNMVRGPGGTAVELTLERAGSSNIEKVTLLREKVAQSSVPYSFMIDGEVGYIAMTGGFTYSTFVEFETALNNLKAAGARSLILDLRGNSGGVFDTAVEVAEKFLPAGADIVTQRGRYPYQDRKWRSGNKQPESMPLVLLIDGRTASASEIVAGAMQDNDRALLVGEKSFGKGLVQNVLDLPDGSGLTLTAARYYTPAGRSIQRDYSDSGLYEYFTQTNRSALIEKAEFAAMTVTNRRVYGGDGIAPDRKALPIAVTPEEDRLVDEAFHFAVRTLRDPQTREAIRQNVLFGRPVADDALLGEFLAEVDGLQSNTVTASRDHLAYFLALGAFGDDAAAAQQVIADPVVKAAIEEIPRAKLLMEAAKGARRR